MGGGAHVTAVQSGTTGWVDPRIERTREVVHRAALEELGDVGYGGITIEAVAARSGVAKSTIYRHWRDKLALIADAFETSHQQMVPSVETGTARERVERLVRHVADVVVDSTFSRCIPALIEGAARDARLRAFHFSYNAERRQSLVAIVREGVASGEFAGDTDAELAAQELLGVIFYLRLMSDRPFDPDDAACLVSDVLVPGRRPRKRPATKQVTSAVDRAATRR
jgi:AcrR family transcriptional regulator